MAEFALWNAVRDLQGKVEVLEQGTKPVERELARITSDEMRLVRDELQKLRGEIQALKMRMGKQAA